jgi:uroporphyrinogen-III synthase
MICAPACRTAFWRPSAEPAVRVLVLREAEAAEQTASALRSAGHAPFVAPMTKVLALPHPAFPAAVDALLLTSPATARLLAAQNTPFPLAQVLAVGDRTAEAARAAGYRDVASAGGDATDLVRLAQARLPPGAVLLCPGAAHPAHDLAALLSPHGFHVEVRALYRSAPVPALPAGLAAALQGRRIDAALHFSALAARTLIALAGSADLAVFLREIPHLCLSARVAEPLLDAGLATCVSEKPNQTALLALLKGAPGLPGGVSTRH